MVLTTSDKKHAIQIYTARHEWIRSINYYITDTKLLVVPTTMTTTNQLKVVAAYCNDQRWRDLLPTSVPAMMWLYKHVVYLNFKDKTFELGLVRRVLGSVVAYFEASDQDTQQRAKHENSQLITHLERNFGTCFANLTDVQKLAIGYIVQMCKAMEPVVSFMIPSIDYVFLVGDQVPIRREDCKILAIRDGVAEQLHEHCNITDMFDQSLFTYTQRVKHGMSHLFLHNKGAVHDLGSIASQYSRFSVCGKYLFVLKDALAETNFEVLHVTVDEFACKKLSEFSASPDNQQDVDVGRLLSSTRRFVRNGAVTDHEVFF